MRPRNRLFRPGGDEKQESAGACLPQARPPDEPPVGGHGYVQERSQWKRLVDVTVELVNSRGIYRVRVHLGGCDPQGLAIC